MVWDVRESDFQSFFDLLKAFAAREGHTAVPQKHLEGSRKLGLWVTGLRSRREKLSEKQQQMLEEIGFSWNPLDQRFDRKLKVLKSFVAREGHARVPDKYREGDVNLGSWVGYLRANKAKLPAAAVKTLNEIGFVWNLSKPKSRK
jgi:hypothetical protein